MARRISPAGLDFLKPWEGCRLEAYVDSGGLPTIGTGHTRGVLLGQTITAEQADELLREDLAEAEAAVERLVRVPLSDNQHAALVSFAFNCGAGALARSTLLVALNGGDYAEVPPQLMRWNRDGGRVVPGLTNRRAAEAALWSTA